MGGFLVYVAVWNKDCLNHVDICKCWMWFRRKQNKVLEMQWWMSHTRKEVRLYAIDSQKAQSLTGRTTTVKWPTQRDIPLIGVDQIKPCESQGYSNVQHRVGEPLIVITKTLSQQITPKQTTLQYTSQPDQSTITPRVLFIRGVFTIVGNSFIRKVINLTTKAINI